MKKQILTVATLIVGFLAGASALSVLAQTSGTWTAPSVAAPGNNVAAPINVGNVTQQKAGGLWIHSGLSVDGNLIIATGTPAKGASLVSLDNIGTVGWSTTGPSSTQDCNTVGTGAITNGMAANLDLTVLPLTINGKNICVSERGCYIDIWDEGTISTSRLYIDYYGSGALYRQGVTGWNGAWFFSQNNSTGNNGNSTASPLTGWWHNLNIFDDYVNSGSYNIAGQTMAFVTLNNQTNKMDFNESSPDYLTVANTGNHFFEVSVCKAGAN